MGNADGIDEKPQDKTDESIGPKLPLVDGEQHARHHCQGAERKQNIEQGGDEFARPKRPPERAVNIVYDARNKTTVHGGHENIGLAHRRFHARAYLNTFLKKPPPFCRCSSWSL